jgi:organic hydroperoxide reductase OsmC/OhrA
MPSPKLHAYEAQVVWTGNLGAGTSTYRAYERSADLAAGAAPVIPGSSDPAFRGDPARWNPEQLLLASIAQCHMLWYLHLCAIGGVTVTAYADRATATMAERPDGGGHFTEAVLHPAVEVAEPEMRQKALALHEEAHGLCFIANSVNFPIRHTPSVTVSPATP